MRRITRRHSVTFEAVSISAACYLTLQNKITTNLQPTYFKVHIWDLWFSWCPSNMKNHFRNVMVCKAMKNINPKPWVLLSENTIRSFCKLHYINVYYKSRESLDSNSNSQNQVFTCLTIFLLRTYCKPGITIACRTVTSEVSIVGPVWIPLLSEMTFSSFNYMKK